MLSDGFCELREFINFTPIKRDLPVSNFEFDIFSRSKIKFVMCYLSDSLFSKYSVKISIVNHPCYLLIINRFTADYTKSLGNRPTLQFMLGVPARDAIITSSTS